MAESHWDGLRDKEVRYFDRTWGLTGDIDIRNSGELIAAEARRVDGVKHEKATLFFRLENPPDSLNPGDLGEHFHSLVWEDGDPHLVVRKEPKTYRYRLHRLEYA